MIREDLLREKTHKDDGVDLVTRVFSTLSDNNATQSHRNSKALAFLLGRLHSQGLLSDDDIDEILLECAM